MNAVPMELISSFLNDLDTTLEKLHAVAEVAPLMDDLSNGDKGRLAILLRSLMSDYLDRIARDCRMFATELPRQTSGESGACP